MARAVHHDGTGKLEITFPYNPKLVSLVKDNIPGRRWDPELKLWWTTDKEVVAVVDTLRSHDFEFDEATLSLYATQSEQAPDHLTVSRLNQRAHRAIKQAFDEPVWVVGQLADYVKGHRNATSRKGTSMLFFSLLEVDDAQATVAGVSCKLTEKMLAKLEAKLDAAGRPFELTDEATVRLKATAEIYPRRGSFQLDIVDLDVQFTLGEVARRREAIRRQLAAEGLLHKNRTCTLPKLPLRLGLITSVESDAYHDVLKTLRDSGFGFHVDVVDARVQGQNTERTVLAALATLAARAHQLDAVMICRGGGSRTDLAWFDNEHLGRAVADFPLPVIVGIGHEADSGVMDDVGWSHKTPTAAAGFFVALVHEALVSIEQAGADIMTRTGRLLALSHQRLNERGHRLAQAAKQRLVSAQLRLDRRSERVATASHHRLALTERTLSHQADALGRAVTTLLWKRSAALDQVLERLGREATRRLSRAEERLVARQERLRLVDPARLLERGYAMLRTPTGEFLMSIQDAPKGTAVQARLADGVLDLVSNGPRGQEDPG